MTSIASKSLQTVLAVVLTVLLLGFLVFARWLDARQVPDRVIRVVDTAMPVALPAPPPPPEEMQESADLPPPPPPPEVELPHLDLQIEAVAPPLAARLDPKLQMNMQSSPFDLEVDPVAAPAPAPATTVARSTTSAPRPAPTPVPAPAVRTSYDAGELDAKPHLVNRPSATYPRDQLRAGVKEGRVLLEVAIGTSGRVTVRRVIASSHADFTAMAREFAGRARFSIPKKDGRAVTAIYRWPLILRP